MSSFTARAIVSLALVVLAGCASPPSVTPLMRVVASTLDTEAQRVDADIEQVMRWHTAQKQALRAGFEADLASQATLEPRWVSEHVLVYVTARELLLNNRLEQVAAAEQRRTNLELAAEAQRRAIGLIEQQDALLQRVPDLRRWVIEQQREDGR